MPLKMPVQKFKKSQSFFFMGNLIIWIKDQRKLSISVYEYKNFVFKRKNFSNSNCSSSNLWHLNWLVHLVLIFFSLEAITWTPRLELYEVFEFENRVIEEIRYFPTDFTFRFADSGGQQAMRNLKDPINIPGYKPPLYYQCDDSQERLTIMIERQRP